MESSILASAPRKNQGPYYDGRFYLIRLKYYHRYYIINITIRGNSFIFTLMCLMSGGQKK